MLATTKFKQPDMVAHIVSPYILAGDNTCIQVYYQTQGGVLNIRTVATDSTLTTGTVIELSSRVKCVCVFRCVMGSSLGLAVDLLWFLATFFMLQIGNG